MPQRLSPSLSHGLTDSEAGFGMALLLTRTLIERMGGEFVLMPRKEAIQVEVRLPLDEPL